jgi:pimeloyl-ACP methyl ester carboxylesterase
MGVLSGMLFHGKYPQQPGAFARQRQASRAYDCMDRLGEIHVPTTILHGRRDRLVPLREAESMHRGIAGSKMVTFNGGHIFFVMRERPRFLACVATAMAA